MIYFTIELLSSSGKFILNMTDKLAFHPNVLTEDPVQLTVPGGCATEYFQNSINLVDNYGTRYVFRGNLPMPVNQQLIQMEYPTIHHGRFLLLNRSMVRG